MALPTKKTKYARQAKDYIMMVFGPPGVGKTTFVNNFGEVLILSTDRGTRFITAMREECLTWTKFDKVITQLEAPGAPHYDYVCVDHVDDFANMAEEATCKALGVTSLSDAAFGKGWKAYRQRIDRFIRRIMRLNTGMVFIAHEEMKTVKVRGMEITKTFPLMSKTAWRVIIPICDVVAFAGYRTLRMKDEKGKAGRAKEIRTVETEPKAELYAKDRTDRTRPDAGYAPLDGAAFLATFTDGEGNTTPPDTEDNPDGKQGQRHDDQGQEAPRRGRRGRRTRS